MSLTRNYFCPHLWPEVGSRQERAGEANPDPRQGLPVQLLTAPHSSFSSILVSSFLQVFRSVKTILDNSSRLRFGSR